MNLSKQVEYVGSISSALIMEKAKILNYAIIHGDLPPGNKIFK